MTAQFSVSRNIAILLIIASSALASIAQAETNTGCDVEKTKKDLVTMIDRDVHVRLIFPGLLKDAEAKKGRKLTRAEIMPLAADLQQADKTNQDELDRIVAACGWPRKDVLGAESVRIASMIMVHAPSEFTDKYITQITASYKAGETHPLWMATIIDDRLLEEGKPQRYGTRSQSFNSDAAPTLTEDPEHLEERRRAFGIMPAQHDVSQNF